MSTCPACSRTSTSVSLYCTHCGEQIALRCDQCGRLSPVPATYCTHCRTPLRAGFSGLPSKEAGAWRRAFRDIGWRESELVLAAHKLLVEQGDLEPGQLSYDDFLIAVPVNGDAGRPHLVTVNGALRIDNRLGRAASEDRHRVAVGELPIAPTRDGHLLATRNSFLILTLSPIQWEWWPYADIRRFESAVGAFDWEDAFGNTVSVRIRSALSLGRHLFAGFNVLFNKDPFDRALNFEDIRSLRERDGDLAGVLFAFMEAVTAVR